MALAMLALPPGRPSTSSSETSRPSRQPRPPPPAKPSNTPTRNALARAVLNPGRIPSVVDEGKFSADFTPVARARLEAMRASLPKP